MLHFPEEPGLTENSMERGQQAYNDCAVLVTALRNRLARPGVADPAYPAGLRAELGPLIDLVDARPHDVPFLSALVDVARSLVVLRRPIEALDCVEAVLSDLR